MSFIQRTRSHGELGGERFQAVSEVELGKVKPRAADQVWHHAQPTQLFTQQHLRLGMFDSLPFAQAYEDLRYLEYHGVFAQFQYHNITLRELRDAAEIPQLNTLRPCLLNFLHETLLAPDTYRPLVLTSL